MKYGIGYGDDSGAMFIDMAAAKTLEPAREIQATMPATSLAAMPWSPWGTNNLLPLEMVADIKSCLLYSIIEGRSRFAICQGMVPVLTRIDETTGQKIIDKYLDDPEINDFLDMNNMFQQTFAWIKDYVGFLRCMTRIMLDRERKKIVLIRRDDVTETRMAKKDAHGNIRNVWYSAEWNRVSSIDDTKVFSKPLLNVINPTYDLQRRILNGDTNYEYAISSTHPGWNEQYYPVPLWMAAIKWIKIAQAIPEMKAAMYENSIRAKMMVIIYEGYWEKSYGEKWSSLTEKEKADFRTTVYDDIEKFLVGAKNAGKAIFTTGYRDRDGKTYAEIEIKPLDDTSKAGEYLPDSAAANSEIAFSMLWNNAMTGGNQATGLYSQNQGGSNVREASTMQVIIHEVERMQIKNIMNVVAHVNGWKTKYPGLDFIIPATLLTTLDTGAGSKPVVTGDSKPADKPPAKPPAPKGGEQQTTEDE